MRSPRVFALGLLTTWLLAVGTSAQTPSPTGNLYGTALDAQGNPVIGATATIAGPGAAQTSNTGTWGDFHFLSLSPGAYFVTVERTGFETASRELEEAQRRVEPMVRQLDWAHRR